MKTPLIYDFDAIGAAAPEAAGFGEDQAAFAGKIEASVRPGVTLAELIAEEKRAWDATTPVRAKADRLYYAWREQHPKLDIKIEDEEDLPEPMGELYRRTNKLQQTASDLTNWICSLVPETLAEAIMLLDWHGKQGGVEDDVPVNVLAGLRAITEGDPAASLLAPNVSRDDEILRLFREWRAAERYANSGSFSDGDDDPDFLAAAARTTEIEDEIADTPAAGAAGLAVKIYLMQHEGSLVSHGDCCVLAPSEYASSVELSVLADAARFVPELERLCAPKLAEWHADEAEDEELSRGQ